MASKFVLEKLDVSILLFLRFAIAAAILLLILKTQELPKIEKKDYPIIFFIGFCLKWFLAVGHPLFQRIGFLHY